MFAFFRSQSNYKGKSDNFIKQRENGSYQKKETQNRKVSSVTTSKEVPYRHQEANRVKKSESEIHKNEVKSDEELKQTSQINLKSSVKEGRETNRTTTLKIPIPVSKNQRHRTTNDSQKPFLNIPIKNFSSNSKDELTVSLNSMNTTDLSIQTQESQLSYNLDKGRLYKKKRDFKKAKELLVVALDIQIHLNGRENRDTVKLFKELATICQELGEYDEAKFYFEHSVIFSESNSVFGSIGGSTRASSTGSTAKSIQNGSIQVEAKSLAKNISSSSSMKSDVPVITDKTSVASNPVVNESKGLRADADLVPTETTVQTAITKHLKTLKVCESHYGKDSLMSAVIYTVIASCYKHNGEIEKAFDYYEKSLNIREAKIPNSIETGECYHELGLMLHQLDENTESLAYLHNAAQIYEANKKVYRTKKVMRDIRRVCRHIVQKSQKDQNNVQNVK